MFDKLRCLFGFHDWRPCPIDHKAMAEAVGVPGRVYYVPVYCKNCGKSTADKPRSDVSEQEVG